MARKLNIAPGTTKLYTWREQAERWRAAELILNARIWKLQLDSHPDLVEHPQIVIALPTAWFN